MRAPQLTIGMACYDDFDGVYFTVQSLRLMHPEVLDRCELVVMDNHPVGPHADMVRNFLGWIKELPARYIPMPEPVGTSAPRDRVFREAAGAAVLCMDAHVQIVPGALARLLDYYEAHPGSGDLLSGPMLYDDLQQYCTHFDDHWRGEMWGTWGSDPRGASPDGEPFEIGAQGLGLFSCRTDAWPGFNADFRGFGGEEWYIHTKIRQAGHRCLCLPFLRWVHRFGRPSGVTYPLTRWNKVRNYVLGHRELGLPLDRVRQHFVEEKDPQGRTLFAEADWQAVLGGAVEPPASSPSCGSCGSQNGYPKTLAEWYQKAAAEPSDINEHCPKLRELASQCMHVTEFGMRHGVSTVALLSGQPQVLVSYDRQRFAVAEALKQRQEKCEFRASLGDSLQVDIDETDLLFIDTRHTAEHLYGELTRHAARVRRWIALHDTQIFGERGEDGGPGLLAALRRFVREQPEWSVIYHTQANHGFTVLSRLAEDKQALPGLARQAWNYAKALATHAASGAQVVSQEQLAARLDVCSLCEHRTDSRCSVCGCYLDQGPNGAEGKAQWRDQVCPLGKWTEADTRHGEST